MVIMNLHTHTHSLTHCTLFMQSLVPILFAFPAAETSQLLQWVQRLSRTNKVGHRMFALELATEVLKVREREREKNGNGG